LVRSRKEGAGFDRIEPVYERYVRNATASQIEIWTLAHQPQRILAGKKLRIITPARATVHWSFDGWETVKDLETRDSGVGCWFAELPAGELPPGSTIAFTFRWPERWEGREYSVATAKPRDQRTVAEAEPAIARASYLIRSKLFC